VLRTDCALQPCANLTADASNPSLVEKVWSAEVVRLLR
jgi:hypothetical protein